VQGHGLRATFASVAEELVSGAVLKRMLNHAPGNDVTLGHYIGKSEAQLRNGWQTVANFIETAAARAARELTSASTQSRHDHGPPEAPIEDAVCEDVCRHEERTVRQ
jgi:hypothetical protein